MALKSVKVPEQMSALFEKAEVYVSNYFSSFKSDREKGIITIGGHRYILMRAESLRLNFGKHIGEALELSEEYEEIAANNFLYILSKSIGQEDAKYFSNVQEVKDPIGKLAAGPISFNYSGWAFVDIFPESRPSPDENYLLVYDHPYSFEADAFISKKGPTSSFPVCVMNAGYSAGWCSESFSLNLEAREIMCRAKGDKACRFVMGIKDKLDGYAQWALKNIHK